MPIVEEDKTSRNKRVSIFAAGSIVVLIIATVSVTAYQMSQSGCNSSSGQDLLKQAAHSLDQSKQKVLRPIVAQIRNLPNFDQDQNCLYVVVSYDVFSSNASDGRINIDKLIKISGPSHAYSPILGKTQDIASLESDITLLEKSTTEPYIQTTSVNNQ
jgi:hypothetical protein